ADFVSGGRELASSVGGTLYVSDYGDDLGYKMSDSEIVNGVRRLREGDVIKVGSLKLEVMHTPGHTPEHLCYLLTADDADKPFAIFSGDCLFAGDMGRPDLLETAVGIMGSAETGAKGQFAAMKRLKAMPDYLQVLPGHGAGSACGKALGDVPSTTLGYEKLFNPAFQIADEAQFVTWLLEGQPPVPRYFARMKKVNQQGAVAVNSLKWPRPVVYDSELKLARDFLMIDTRPTQIFASSHIPNTVNIPISDTKFSTYAGGYVDYDQPTYLVVDSQDLEAVVDRLHAIGVDNLGGYVSTHIAERYHTATSLYDVEEAQAAQLEGALLLDVRNLNEYQEMHIPGALLIPMDEIAGRMNELPRDREIILYCAAGTRSSIVTSWLQKRGVLNTAHLIGGINAWKQAGLPVESEK
ncbi:MAG TPA: rhodanese-like domain-containing protein, partial [Phototrophicaceae bacterium]|nr:rhodanese-like domain-containing protein [Phototrophicaceae bacterium]